MSDNIRTALYAAEYSATLASRRSTAPPVLARVVGKHCEGGDILVRDEFLPADIAPDDLIAVPASGAYSRSMASNYNHVPRPVVAVRDGNLTTPGTPGDHRGPAGPRRRLMGWLRPMRNSRLRLETEVAARPSPPRSERVPTTAAASPLRVALLGCGTVGSKVAG